MVGQFVGAMKGWEFLEKLNLIRPLTADSLLEKIGNNVCTALCGACREGRGGDLCPSSA